MARRRYGLAAAHPAGLERTQGTLSAVSWYDEEGHPVLLGEQTLKFAALEEGEYGCR